MKNAISLAACVVSLVVLGVGCVTQHEPGTGIPLDPNKSSEIRASIGVIGLDEHGLFWADRKSANKNVIANAVDWLTESDPSAQQLLIFFIPGFHSPVNDKVSQTEGRALNAFRKLLLELNSNTKQTRAYGVVLDWPNQSSKIPGLDFVDRQNAARRIAGETLSAAVIGISDSIQKALESKAKEMGKDRTSDKNSFRSIVISHSVGGVLTMNTFAPLLLGRENLPSKVEAKVRKSVEDAEGSLKAISPLLDRTLLGLRNIRRLSDAAENAKTLKQELSRFGGSIDIANEPESDMIEAALGVLFDKEAAATFYRTTKEVHSRLEPVYKAIQELRYNSVELLGDSERRGSLKPDKVEAFKAFIVAIKDAADLSKDVDSNGLRKLVTAVLDQWTLLKPRTFEFPELVSWNSVKEPQTIETTGRGQADTLGNRIEFALDEIAQFQASVKNPESTARFRADIVSYYIAFFSVWQESVQSALTGLEAEPSPASAQAIVAEEKTALAVSQWGLNARLKLGAVKQLKTTLERLASLKFEPLDGSVQEKFIPSEELNDNILLMQKTLDERRELLGDPEKAGDREIFMSQLTRLLTDLAVANAANDWLGTPLNRFNISFSSAQSRDRTRYLRLKMQPFLKKMRDAEVAFAVAGTIADMYKGRLGDIDKYSIDLTAEVKKTVDSLSNAIIDFNVILSGIDNKIADAKEIASLGYQRPDVVILWNPAISQLDLFRLQQAFDFNYPQGPLAFEDAGEFKSKADAESERLAHKMRVMLEEVEGLKRLASLGRPVQLPYIELESIAYELEKSSEALEDIVEYVNYHLSVLKGPYVIVVVQKSDAEIGFLYYNIRRIQRLFTSFQGQRRNFYRQQYVHAPTAGNVLWHTHELLDDLGGYTDAERSEEMPIQDGAKRSNLSRRVWVIKSNTVEGHGFPEASFYAGAIRAILHTKFGQGTARLNPYILRVTPEEVKKFEFTTNPFAPDSAPPSPAYIRRRFK